MPQKNISGKDLRNAITSEDILGKDIIDKDGRIIGVAEKVLIDTETMDFIGISIDKGFFKKGLTIGRDYIKEIKDHAVFLKIPVAYEIEGLMVFDKNGRKMGVVSGVDLHGQKNALTFLHVKPDNISALFRKEVIIPASYVSTIGDNVMLKHSYGEIMARKMKAH